MGEVEVDALVPRSYDVMDVWTREASYVQKHGSLSTLPARYRTWSLNEGIPDAQERRHHCGEAIRWNAWCYWLKKRSYKLT